VTAVNTRAVVTLLYQTLQYDLSFSHNTCVTDDDRNRRRRQTTHRIKDST